MGSLKSPCGTSNRSSIETIVPNCLVFEKIAFLCRHFGDRQTDGRANRRTDGQNQCNALSLSRATPNNTGKQAYVPTIAIAKLVEPRVTAK